MRLLPALLLAASLLALSGCAQRVSMAAGGPAMTATAEEPVSPPWTEINIRSLGQRVPVIMWHDIIATRDENAQWFDCTIEEFEEQMSWIVEQGITPISLDDLYKHLTNGDPIPDRAVVLTFDDNYQGFKDFAVPVLERYRFPASVFVHTGFVGSKEGLHPKMDWATLRELAKHPLITIGGHTISHPDDMSLLPVDQQTKELVDSKEQLEAELGVKIHYLAYPNGKNDAITQELTRSAGYKMAFSIDNMLAEESPSIYCVGRYVHTRLEKAFEDYESAIKGGVSSFSTDLVPSPVNYVQDRFEGFRIAFATGGTPKTAMSASREGVLDFVSREGGVAGINGGFFAISEIAATDNRMVGPLKTAADPTLMPDFERFRWPKLRNRPVVLWGPTRLAIVPYQPDIMTTDEAFRQLMPDYTDLFLAGVWLVHKGIPREEEEMNVFGSKDIQDYRRRAFLGVTADGKMVIGASQGSLKSSQVAQAIAAAGITEAVLLDSGFSTSLIFDGEVKVTGHSREGVPSRPVPHAIVLLGEKDPSLATGISQKEEQKS